MSRAASRRIPLAGCAQSISTLQATPFGRFRADETTPPDPNGQASRRGRHKAAIAPQIAVLASTRQL
jgi:hypothetical protein